MSSESAPVDSLVICLVLCNSAVFLNRSSVIVSLGGEPVRGSGDSVTSQMRACLSQCQCKTSGSPWGNVGLFNYKLIVWHFVFVQWFAWWSLDVRRRVWCLAISRLSLLILADKSRNLAIKDGLCAHSVSQFLKLASTRHYNTLACFGFSFNRYHLFSFAFLGVLLAPD